MSTMGDASLSVMEVLVLEGAAGREGWRARGPPGGALPLHAVRGARAALDSAALLLDLDEHDLPGVVYRVAEVLQAEGLLEEDDKPALLRTLLLSRRSSLASLQVRTVGRAQGMGDGARRASSVATAGGGSEEVQAEAGLVLVGGVGFLARRAAAFVRLARATHLPPLAELAAPVRYLFVLLGPTELESELHEAGRAVAALLSNPAFVALAGGADGKPDLLEAVDEFLDAALVLPPAAPPPGLLARRASAPAHHLPPRDEKSVLLALEATALPVDEPYDPLTKTGRLFGGVVRDVRCRYPHYLSDLTDALNGQCLAATIFMYFAACSSAITFGGLLAEKTHGQIGISETLVFTCLGGVLFALSAGQPLMITGATGPLLLLDESLYAFCRSYEFDFLAARFYCGLWMIAIALCVAAVEGSVAVKKITRFTEDIYAFLISLIFISEPLTATIAVYRAHPLGADYCGAYNGTITHSSNDTGSTFNSTLGGPEVAPLAPQPNTALWCTILTLATFIIAYYLRIFRNGKFLGRSARRALGDFGVPIAIVVMVVASSAVPVWTDRLHVPAGLSPTAPRAWLVPLNPGLQTVPVWAAAAMLLPALMVYIIVFMETHIAELIVDKPERQLKKGSGFHMDVVIVSLVNMLCGLFGAPWQCVATVRSVSHVAALTVMSTKHAPGDKPHILEVKEQRVTGLLVSVMVGLSVAAAGWLRLVPMAVLFGVFLYMGVAALAGIQFWDRLLLLLKPVKHHSSLPYVRRVPTGKLHLFTLIQLGGVCLLFAVKSSRFALAFPFFLVLMVALRMSLDRLFSPLQLRALDGTQMHLEGEDEPDFYEELREAPLPA